MDMSLERIERYSRYVRQDALNITHNVRAIKDRPEFETMAEDAMALAELELAAALEQVRAARANFNQKPVTA